MKRQVLHGREWWFDNDVLYCFYEGREVAIQVPFIVGKIRNGYCRFCDAHDGEGLLNDRAIYLCNTIEEQWTEIHHPQKTLEHWLIGDNACHNKEKPRFLHGVVPEFSISCTVLKPSRRVKMR